MAKGNEVENGKRRRAKGSKIEGKGQSQSQNGSNNKKKNSKSSKSKIEGNGNYVDGEPEVLVAPDSEDDDGEEEEDVVRDGDEEEEEGEETNRAENGGGKEKGEATKKTKKRKGNGKRKKSEGDDDDDSSSTCFPMNRISRIIKSEDADIRITQESVFLVNKATEKFLELFCKEAHACALQGSKNQVWYKHLSSVVSKRKRFDFLLDIVPEKVKAEDALAEMSVAET
ncbi:hypothetical protein RHMOL_Rhmol01G0296100 [Rhododendron molle]|uniref:Uncharacterized protein n=1 Tax=Rhododendron molle TaxID=49168 RepID=A0ACC0Q6J5_RHOML|nr:hypothetical protein RHMOL_Rhmol01G0296100 [Rhododendron molle]